MGKVYFSTDAGDFECSANLVASANQSTLATAGHCLHDGPGSGFVDNFVFAPAYDDGESEEYGVWAAEELVTTPQWAQAADMNFDIGFAVLEEQQGQTIEEVLGTASPIAFNQDRNQQYTAYGYPYEFPYSGESLQSCSGTGQDDPYGGSTQGITCLLTEGSSGGPWFTEGNAGEVQVSVNSHKYEENPFRMYGPYFGDDAMAAYNAAANI